MTDASDRDEITTENVTMTVGELAAWLANFPKEMPVTVLTPDGGGWFNLTGATNPDRMGEPSLILYTSDDFDTRQF